MKKIAAIAILSLLMIGQAYSQTNSKKEIRKNTDQKEYYTFKLSDKVTRQAVTFKKSLWYHHRSRFIPTKKSS